MSEDDIRNFLNKQSTQVIPQALRGRTKRVVRRNPQARPPQEDVPAYKDFSATHLFCPTCKQAMPVREKLMLYLPSGDLYDYLCTECGTSLGTRRAGE